MTEIKLNPCPDCGVDAYLPGAQPHNETAVMIFDVLWRDHYERTQIRCTRCDFTIKGLGRKRMMNLWNSLALPEVDQEDLAKAWVKPDKVNES